MRKLINIEIMKDVSGIEIKIGDTVKTTQPSGGILNPAPPTTGTVCWYDYYNEKILAVSYEKKYNGKIITCYITLEGKINEVIK